MLLVCTYLVVFKVEAHMYLDGLKASKAGLLAYYVGPVLIFTGSK